VSEPDVSQRLLDKGHAAYMKSIEPTLEEISRVVGEYIDEGRRVAHKRIENCLNLDQQIAQDLRDGNTPIPELLRARSGLRTDTI
jgi:hypothetical protein